MDLVDGQVLPETFNCTRNMISICCVVYDGLVDIQWATSAMKLYGADIILELTPLINV
jgi:hypothetical protein